MPLKKDMGCIAYPCLNLSLTMLVKGAPGVDEDITTWAGGCTLVLTSSLSLEVEPLLLTHWPLGDAAVILN